MREGERDFHLQGHLLPARRHAQTPQAAQPGDDLGGGHVLGVLVLKREISGRFLDFNQHPVEIFFLENSGQRRIVHDPLAVIEHPLPVAVERPPRGDRFNQMGLSVKGVHDHILHLVVFNIQPADRIAPVIAAGRDHMFPLIQTDFQLFDAGLVNGSRLVIHPRKKGQAAGKRPEDQHPSEGEIRAVQAEGRDAGAAQGGDLPMLLMLAQSEKDRQQRGDRQDEIQPHRKPEQEIHHNVSGLGVVQRENAHFFEKTREDHQDAEDEDAGPERLEKPPQEIPVHDLHESLTHPPDIWRVPPLPNGRGFSTD
ncbi:MAG: hypothetical protein A2992_07215 [Elusimicrobia bacterium RIFCSPLOWO2_01_FULL_59_12]|nr:MAG: hypothetical protein A2992_07215 [Elusimicrobia bacterium RIFCSPLOWO2_01_FULL_59_12]